MRPDVNTTAIAVAIIVGSLIISAGIYLRKTDFESCVEMSKQNLLDSGANEALATTGALSLCSAG